MRAFITALGCVGLLVLIGSGMMLAPSAAHAQDKFLSQGDSLIGTEFFFASTTTEVDNEKFDRTNIELSVSFGRMLTDSFSLGVEFVFARDDTDNGTANRLIAGIAPEYFIPISSTDTNALALYIRAGIGIAHESAEDDTGEISGIGLALFGDAGLAYRIGSDGGAIVRFGVGISHISIELEAYGKGVLANESATVDTKYTTIGATVGISAYF